MNKCSIVFRLFSLSTVLLAGILVGCAGPVATQVSGTFNSSQENGCLIVSAFYFGVDCTYSRTRESINSKPMPWVGPDVNPIYYKKNTRETNPVYSPAIGDNRIAIELDGTLIVFPDSSDPAKTQVSGKWVLSPGARNMMTRVDQNTRVLRVVESWDAITHEMPTVTVDRAEPNDLGGYDYVIASKGMPERLCLTKDGNNCFPSAAAPTMTEGTWGEKIWNDPSSIPINRAEQLGGNIGATTIAVTQGYQCRDIVAGRDCRSAFGLWGEAPGLDNLLLKVSTDEHNKIVRAEGFWTREFTIGVGPKSVRSPPGQADSWYGGYMELTPAP